jgi:hypothetical protein
VETAQLQTTSTSEINVTSQATFRVILCVVAALVFWAPFANFATRKRLDMAEADQFYYGFPLEMAVQRQQGAGHAQVAAAGGCSEVGLGQRSRADAAGHTWGGTLASKAKPTRGMLWVFGVRLRTRKYKTS